MLLRWSILENGSHQKKNAPKENEVSKMKITNGEDHYFLKYFKINFTPVNFTFFLKYYHQASSNNSVY
jgi:hypothetical protein